MLALIGEILFGVPLSLKNDWGGLPFTLEYYASSSIGPMDVL